MSFIVQPQTLLSILFGPSRSFGTAQNIFKGYVVLSENITDAIEITQQPVQQGANIADHAFKKPIVFGSQYQFAASILPSFSLTTGITPPQSLSTIYKNLVALQQSFIPFTVTTPKRTLGNMLFSSLGVVTGKTTENVLAINCSFQQIITVPVGVATVPRSQLKNPGSNGGTQQAGVKSSFLNTSVNAARSVAGG